MNGPGTVVDAANDSPECKAWRQAAESWCKEWNDHKDAVKAWEKNPQGPKPSLNRGSFNDRYFQGLNQAGVTGIQREVPLGFSRGRGAFTPSELADRLGPGPLSDLASTAGVGGSALSTAGAGLGMTSGGRAWDAARRNMRTEFQALSDAGCHPFFPDGLTPGGTALEVKGPGDRLGPGQAQKYAKTAPEKKCVVISAKSCDPGGEITTPGGACKRK